MSKIELESSLTLRGRMSFTETKIGVRAMVRASVRAMVIIGLGLGLGLG